MANFIDKDCKSVMDCRSGAMSLKKMISSDIKYYPVDKIKRTEETILCDFNKGDFPNINVDYIVLSGILEYISNPLGFIRNVCLHSDNVVIAYNTIDRNDQNFDFAYRLSKGWLTHLTTAQLIMIFQNYGFNVSDTQFTENCETYLKFTKNEKIFSTQRK